MFPRAATDFQEEKATVSVRERVRCTFYRRLQMNAIFSHKTQKGRVMLSKRSFPYGTLSPYLSFSNIVPLASGWVYRFTFAQFSTSDLEKNSGSTPSVTSRLPVIF